VRIQFVGIGIIYINLGHNIIRYNRGYSKLKIGNLAYNHINVTILKTNSMNMLNTPNPKKQYKKRDEKRNKLGLIQG